MMISCGTVVWLSMERTHLASISGLSLLGIMMLMSLEYAESMLYLPVSDSLIRFPFQSSTL